MIGFADVDGRKICIQDCVLPGFRPLSTDTMWDGDTFQYKKRSLWIHGLKQRLAVFTRLSCVAFRPSILKLQPPPVILLVNNLNFDLWTEMVIAEGWTNLS